MKIPHIKFLSLIMALTITSCADEVMVSDTDESTGEIDFNINGDWNDAADSRGDVENDTLHSNNQILKEIIPIATGNGMDSLYLHIYEEPTPMPTKVDTRGSFQSGLYSNMSITGFKFDHSTGWSDEIVPDFMYNVKYEKSGEYYKVPEGNLKYVWPGYRYDTRFFAVMPYGTGTLSTVSKKGAPTLTYTVPTNVTSQTELFVGQTETLPGWGLRRVSLNMQRALASIRFEESDDILGGTIKTITIKNVIGGGTYYFDQDEWITNNTIVSYQVSPDKSVPTTSGSAITNSQQNFFLIPQTFPTNAQIQISFHPGWTATTNCTLSAPLTGTLEAGKSYVYRIATTKAQYEDQFSVSIPETLSLTSSTSTTIGTLSIVSKRNVMHDDAGLLGSGDLKWTTKFYDYNPTTGEFDIPLSAAPSWLGGTVATGQGNKTYTLSMKGTPTSYATQYNNILKEAPERGTTERPWNLANATGDEKDENTANCYIVNAPGRYSIPLAYGNAIKNGSYNPALFNGMSPTTHPKVLGPYPRAMYINEDGYGKERDVTATSAYIYNLGGENISPEEYIKATYARWQDKTNLITNITLSEDHKRIEFTITRSNIEQGNAFIVVYGSTSREPFLWGWHIWVTHYEPGVGDKTVTDKNGNKTVFMPYNLGWVDNTKVYPEVKPVRMEITQDATGKKIDHILRFSEQTVIDGHSVLWEEGNPFPRLSTRNKHYFPTDNLENYVQMAGSLLMARIFAMDISDNSGKKPEYYNLWDFGKTSGDFGNWLNYEQIKTLYDPCPVGYNVAGVYAYTGFTENGLKAGSYEYTNSALKSKYIGGITLQCESDGQEDEIVFPNTQFANYRSTFTTPTYSVLSIPYSNGESTRTFTPNVVFTSDGSIKFNSNFDNTSSSDLKYPIYLQIRPIRELE